MPKKFFIYISLLVICFTIKAQEKNESKFNFELNYFTEFQSNFSNKKVNWLNLLDLNFDFHPWKNGIFEIETITIFKTQKNRIADDFQIFSNIDDDRHPFNIYVGGYKHVFGKISVQTSFLLSSSAGI